MKIWERHVQLMREERAEREKILEPFHEKYDALYRALKEECAQIGHEWHFSHFNVGYDACYKCNFCGAGRVEKNEAQ